MKVEFFVRTDSTTAEIDIEMEGELDVDFDKHDVALAVQDALDADGYDIDAGEVPDQLEMVAGWVETLSIG